MSSVVLVVHLLITAVMIFLILMQKSEGNAAGGGFGASVSVTNMMQPRARPNAVSRATTVLGIGFFVTSLGLALLARNEAPAPSLLSEPTGGAPSVPRVEDTAPPAVPTAPGADAPAAAPAAAPAPGAAAPATPGGAPAVPQE